MDSPTQTAGETAWTARLNTVLAKNGEGFRTARPIKGARYGIELFRLSDNTPLQWMHSKDKRAIGRTIREMAKTW